MHIHRLHTSTTSDLRPSQWGCIDCSVNLSAKASYGDVRCLIVAGKLCRGRCGSLIVYPYTLSSQSCLFFSRALLAVGCSNAHADI